MITYNCMFKVPVKLVGAIPHSLRKYLSLVRKASLPFVPAVGMSIQLSYADIEEGGGEDESEDYGVVEHVHYDLPNNRFLCMCEGHVHAVEKDWERKVEQLKEWGWRDESI